MAQYNKKRQKELKHDAFRDNTLQFLDRLGDRLEGKGMYIVYGLAGLLALAILAGLFSWRSNRKEQEARQALGRAISISEGTIGPATPTSGEFNFSTEQERATRSAEEFQRVADKYGEPFHSKALYLGALQRLTIDRAQGISELEKLKNDNNADVSAWAKFALAQAREAGGEYDAAAALYQELAGRTDSAIPTDLTKERLAAVYEKTGKKKEAVDLLYGIVESSRNAKDKDGKPALQSGTAREAERRLQILDPARYQQLPSPPSPLGNLNLG